MIVSTASVNVDAENEHEAMAKGKKAISQYFPGSYEVTDLKAVGEANGQGFVTRWRVTVFAERVIHED